MAPRNYSNGKEKSSLQKKLDLLKTADKKAVEEAVKNINKEEQYPWFEIQAHWKSIPIGYENKSNTVWSAWAKCKPGEDCSEADTGEFENRPKEPRARALWFAAHCESHGFYARIIEHGRNRQAIEIYRTPGSEIYP